MSIQEGSLASLAIIKEVDWGVTPENPTFLEVGITSESLKSGIAFEKSEQLSSNPYTSDVILTGGEASGDINLEWYYGAEIDLLLETMVRGSFVSTELKAGREYKSLSIMKTFYGEEEITNFDYTGMRVNTGTIQAQIDQGKITGTIGFMGKQEIMRPNYFLFNGTTVPPAWLGADEAIWLKSDTGVVYRWTKATQEWTIEDEDWDSSASWTAGTGAPTSTPSADDWYIDTATGTYYKYVVDTWVLQYTLLPSGATWYSGATAPSDATGVAGDLAIDTTTGIQYQKIDDVGDGDGTWTALVDPDGTAISLWYTGRTLTAKTDAKVFSSPEVQSIVFTNFDNDLCFQELSLNINNNVEGLKGFCTDTSEYPHVSNIQARYGAGDYEMTLNTYFSSQEMYRKYLNGVEIAFNYLLTDGSDGYKLEIGSGYPTDAGVNTGGNNTTVAIPFKVMLTDNNTDVSPLVITKTSL